MRSRWLLGFIQMGTGALISTGIGFFGAASVITLLSGSALLGLAVFAIGRRFVPKLIEAPEDDHRSGSLTRPD